MVSEAVGLCPAGGADAPSTSCSFFKLLVLSALKLWIAASMVKVYKDDGRPSRC